MLAWSAAKVLLPAISASPGSTIPSLSASRKKLPWPCASSEVTDTVTAVARASSRSVTANPIDLTCPSYWVALLEAEGASLVGVSVTFNAVNAELPPPPS